LHDEVTGLANRALFRDRLVHALAGRERHVRPLAVLCLDIDGFKAVNDAHGHESGDRLLTLVAERVSSSVRPGDTVARLGGDEFAVLLEEMQDDRDAHDIAERIRDAMRAPFEIGAGREAQVHVSIGYAVYRGDESTDILLRNGDLAMYRAKSARGGGLVCYEPAMHAALLERLQLDDDLRRALPAGALRLHYQPTYELATGRCVGAEALLRWEHPTRGLLPPAAFLAAAEDSGLIVEFGGWVLAESCRQLAQWRELPDAGELWVAVNVAAVQLEDPDLYGKVTRALQASGLPAQALVLEMTESALIEQTDSVLALLSALKELGVRVAIDDFGTGYSSLSYLSRFPVDALKVDRSFVERVDGTPDEAELARTIVRLGHGLRLVTVAEGIETVEQLAALRQLGCTMGQGYLYARPMAAEAIEPLLATRAAVD
ncbi:MAG TPA: EAL domain-containing protein, partial [Mycobacteriales bacterium]|nr:EAL domain-containing protein [Mycobacteriales bacterium]